MKAEDCRQIANSWMDAFNSHDLNKLLNLYADDAIHFSPKLLERKPETGGLIKGKQALHDWWQDAFHRLPSLNYKPTNFIVQQDSVFMEYLRTVDGEKDLRVGEVLEMKEGKIVASRVYHG